MENKIMMPASYNVLSCEEMTYTEGGATFTEALLNWIPPIAGTWVLPPCATTARATPTTGWIPVWML